MHQALVRKLVCGGLLACQVACIEDSLLGENPSDAGTSDAAVAPTIEGPSSTPPFAQQFPVKATKSIAPTWIYDFPCDGPCAGLPQIELAPDGGVWAALIASGPGLRNRDLMFVNLDAHGQTLGTFTSPVEDTEKASPLLVDHERQPYALRWPMVPNSAAKQARIYRIAEGELRATPLPPIQQPDTKFLSALADGSYLEMSAFGASYVAHHSADGKQLWRQDDLRDVQLGFGWAPPLDGPVYLDDGAIVIPNVPKSLDDMASEPVTVALPGLTVLNADGSLRWDMVLYPVIGSPGAMQIVAARPNAGLAIATSMSVDSDVQIVSHDGDGAKLGHWVGTRVGYHTVGARALGVDELGDLYPVLLSGERDQPRLTVCKLHASDPRAPVSCVALDIAPPPSGSLAPWGSPEIDITLSAPNVAVLALRRSEGDALLTSVMRVDLPL